MKLNQKKCKPCEGGIPALSSSEIEEYRKQLHADWLVKDKKLIYREWKFVNFVQTMKFVNKVAQVAEEEGHHPVIHVGYGTCTIEIWTHAIDGLSENDFILAAKIDELSGG